MTTKKIFFSLLALVLFVGVSFGQGRRKGWKKKSPEFRADKLTKKMTGPLKLTADQQTSIKATHLDAETKLDDLRAKRKDGSLDKDAFKAQRKAVNKERRTKIKEVLNDEQKAKFKKWKKNRRKRRKGKGRKGKKGDGDDVDDDIDDEG